MQRLSKMRNTDKSKLPPRTALDEHLERVRDELEAYNKKIKSKQEAKNGHSRKRT
jgi:hypothetical protein